MEPYFPAAQYRISPSSKENPPVGILNGPVNSVGNGLSAAGKYIGDSLVSPAAGASPPPWYGGSTTDADGSPSALPVRCLVGRIVDDPRASASDAGPLAAPSPSNGFLSPDRTDSFDDRFGNWAPSAAGISAGNPNQLLPPQQTGGGGTLNYYNNSLARASAGGRGDTFPDPQQSQGAAPPYSNEYLEFLNQLNGNNSPVPLFNPTNPPPLFAPPNYSTAGNNSIEKWIASLTDADPEDPTPFSMPAMFNPYLGR
jgi:hypothetical protein